MVELRVYTIDGPVDLEAQGFWISPRLGEIVIRGDVPRKLEAWPGEGVLFDPMPLVAARQLEGTHARIVVKVGAQELRMEGVRIEMRGVTLVIKASATVHRELSDPSEVTSLA